MRPVLQIAAGLAFVAVAACQPIAEEAAPPASGDCRHDGSMPDIKMCAGEELGKEQARMERYFAAAMTRARASDAESIKYGPRTRQVAWLENSQRDWQAYAESRCGVWLPDGSGGTVGGLFYSECLIGATRQRTHDIWGDYLTFMSDTTPPVLPEPVRTVKEEERARTPMPSAPSTAPEARPDTTG